MSDEHHSTTGADRDQPSQAGQASSPSAAAPGALGIAGSMARAFIHSPLSPLLYFAMVVLGVVGLIATPRQEDPQISVPMVDVFFDYPGASADQVAGLALDPLQRIVSEIPGVKHVYGMARRDGGLVTVQFDVGEPHGPSEDKVRNKIAANKDLVPPGVGEPLVKAKGIDDVPVVTLTLWSDRYDDSALRAISLAVLQRLKAVPGTGNAFVVGGRRDQVRVEVAPQRLSGFGISLDQVARTIRTANAETDAGSVEFGGRQFTVYAGAYLRTADDIGRLVVGAHQGAPVYVRDIATVTRQPEVPAAMVNYYTGAAYQGDRRAVAAPAVTIAIAKKVGTNGVTVANAVLATVASLTGQSIPADVHVAVTRNYGETADDKVTGLLIKLMIATVAVTLLVLAALGLRPAVVVTLVIPVVLMMTVFGAFIGGYTIDRVSMFALIFAIGILVDDAIVVVENIYRRWLQAGSMDAALAVDAVREVGNPTILATFTVVAALLPMGFVSGMMGPYMGPIPVLGSVAMILSLFAAFIFTPYLAMRLKPGLSALRRQEQRERRSAEALETLFRRIITPLVERRRWGWLFLGGLVAVFLFAVMLLYPFKAVPVKMLPYDNKPEFSVVIDMPEGTALPVTANVTHRIAERLRQLPEVVAVQTYVGAAKPFDFNGMVRHYYLRAQPWQAQVQVQLLDKQARDRSSHRIALAARDELARLRDAVATGVNGPVAPLAQAVTTVVEMPPGPPVLQAVVAEVYGRERQARVAMAEDLTRIFNAAERLTDVDNMMQSGHEVWRFEVNTEKAVRRGISVDAINRNLRMALGGFILGDVKRQTGLEPTYIVIQVPLALRAQINRMLELPIGMPDGGTIALAELGRFVRDAQDPIHYYKDLRPVEYVVADVAGRLAAPIYGMADVERALRHYHGEDQPYVAADGTPVTGGTMTGPPPDDGRVAFEWTGEWTVTYETFRDMGIAFAAALVLIYILVVWEFGNFVVPLVIMAPIPLTLIGIVPGHALLGWLTGSGEFTATSMIGFIALAGIIVRNSILLVDFTLHEMRNGADVQAAVVLACKARTRPILITALALVAGSFVILADPIFQGMATSLLFGVLVSTVLTLVVIPLGCVTARRSMDVLARRRGGRLDKD